MAGGGPDRDGSSSETFGPLGEATPSETWGPDDSTDVVTVPPGVVPSTPNMDGFTGSESSMLTGGEEIGRGAMGVVQAVTDVRLGRAVARKILLSHKPGASARFLREARITAQLEHPSIVPVYFAGQDSEGQLFYTMKQVDGHTLKALIAERPLLSDRMELIDALVSVCQAVAYAHARGVLQSERQTRALSAFPAGSALASLLLR